MKFVISFPLAGKGFTISGNCWYTEIVKQIAIWGSALIRKIYEATWINRHKTEFSAGFANETLLANVEVLDQTMKFPSHSESIFIVCINVWPFLVLPIIDFLCMSEQIKRYFRYLANMIGENGVWSWPASTFMLLKGFSWIFKLLPFSRSLCSILHTFLKDFQLTFNSTANRIPPFSCQDILFLKLI